MPGLVGQGREKPRRTVWFPLGTASPGTQGAEQPHGYRGQVGRRVGSVSAGPSTRGQVEGEV